MQNLLFHHRLLEKSYNNRIHLTVKSVSFFCDAKKTYLFTSSVAGVMQLQGGVMKSNQTKLYEVSKYLGDLNKQGCVKGFSGNENGYAKIFQVRRGCSVWIHNELNGVLIIDLLISPSAQRTYPEKCTRAVHLFKKFFKFHVDSSKWSHCIDTQNNHDRYFVDVSKLSTKELFDICDKIKQIFA